MAERNLAEVTSSLYSLLQPLESEARHRVVHATFALLGETLSGASGAPPHQLTPAPDRGIVRSEAAGQVADGLPIRVQKWLAQNDLGESELEEVFHFSGGKIDVIAGELPGKSKREQTAQAYLLAGLKAFLQTGEAKFSDDDGMKLTKTFGGFDVNNHSANRKSLGNSLSGSKQSGFELSQPGLRNAALLVREIASATRGAG